MAETSGNGIRTPVCIEEVDQELRLQTSEQEARNSKVPRALSVSVGNSRGLAHPEITEGS
jgi:hypothetical protein